MDEDLDYLNERHVAIHAFMGASPQVGDEEKLPHFIQHNGVDWCTKLAAMYARIDLLKPLIEVYHGDIHQEIQLLSDRHRGEKIRHNLIDEVLTHHLYSPSADTSPEGRTRFSDTLEYLFQKGLSANLNKDAMENGVRCAYALAFPERVYDEKRPEYDWILAVDDEMPEAFKGAYALIEHYEPQAITDLQKSFEIEKRRLRMEFSREAAAQRSGGEGTLERVWGKISKALGFDHN